MKVRILEVGPRDGLQNEKKIISLDDKYELVSHLVKAGLKHIEAGAFVSPKAVPQMADSNELLKALTKDFPEVNFYSLVPNLRGLENAMECNLKNLGLLASCCETFSQKNLNTSIKGSLERIKEILDEAPKDCFKRLYLSMTFHSPWTGIISNEIFNNTLERCADLGVDEIVLSDTTGKGTPDLVNNRIFLTQKFFGTERIACHFHDTFNNALSNIEEAVKHRVSRFDSSILGLGGCPYSPDSSGNVSTESVVDFCIANSLETEVVLEKLQLASKFVENLMNNKGTEC